MRELLEKEEKREKSNDQIKITGEKSKYWENTSWNGNYNLGDELRYKNKEKEYNDGWRGEKGNEI
jgi:hypothetical protein